MKTRWTLLILALTLTPAVGSRPATEIPTPPDWRNDQANIEVTRVFNEAVEHVPFSSEFEGVLDHCPFRIDWSVGPNLPMFWKGGIAGVFGDEIVLAGGAWEGEKSHAITYNVKTRQYSEITPPPAATSFTQGAADENHLYLVGGKSAGKTAAKLSRRQDGTWEWKPLPPVPEKGRWTSAVNVVGNRLFLYLGRDIGRPARVDLPAWQLRLDRADARWEPMAPYPGRASSVIISAVARGKIYAFGGWREHSTLGEIREKTDLWNKYRIWPVSSVIEFRDAYRYDPEVNRWTPIRRLPFPMYGGKGIVLKDRYILLMGISSLKRSLRVGKSHPARKPFLDQYWTGFDDTILCYDIERDNYSRVGYMLYGVSSWNWVLVGDRIHSFGGEPKHGFNSNRENVLQIGTIREAPRSMQ